MLQDIQARRIAALPGLDWQLADALAVRLNRNLATLTEVAARVGHGPGAESPPALRARRHQSRAPASNRSSSP
jgi:hypothetical protein